MTDSRLALLGELEQLDAAGARELAELDALYSDTEAMRARARELLAFRERLAVEREARAHELAEAERGVTEAELVAARAAAELEGAEPSGDRELLAAARRFDVRARDALHAAKRRAAEASEGVAKLEAEAEEAEREAALLGERSQELARTLGALPRVGSEAAVPPEPELEDVQEWGSGARAALLVARSQVTAEREAVIRQANELGSALLGEPLTPAPPSAVTRRVERALEPR